MCHASVYASGSVCLLQDRRKPEKAEKGQCLPASADRCQYRAIEQSETPGTKFCRMRTRNLRVQHGQGKEALYFRWTCLCVGEISGAGLCPERPVHPHGGSADRKPALGHLTQFKNSPAAQQKRTSIQKNRCPF